MPKLKRLLGLPMLIFYGTGMILGAGIYSIIGKAVGIAGETVWISLIIAAVTASLAALSYAELASMFPKVGGEFIYLRKAFPKQKWIANSGGFMMSFAGIATSATVSLAFAGYLKQFIPINSQLIALSLLLIFTIINILGIKSSSWLNALFTIIEVIGLLIFIYFGIHSENFGNSLMNLPNFKTVSGSALIIFAFFGFENLVNFVEETKDPKKNLPRAILLSMAISSTLYLLVALSAISLLSIKELAQSSAPLADTIKPISLKMSQVLSAIALFATANTVLVSLVTTSRILLGMARENVLPKILKKIGPHRHTPWVTALLAFLFSALLLPINKVQTLAQISAMATMIAFVSVHIALIVLRVKKPFLPRPFHIPFSFKKIPLLPVLGALLTLFLLVQLKF